MADVLDRYELTLIVNVSGTEMVKGASPACPEVIEAESRRSCRAGPRRERDEGAVLLGAEAQALALALIGPHNAV